jgi:hypothetical protein
MDLRDKRNQIAADVFAATGAKVDGYDPLVISALFYSQQLREAGASVAAKLDTAALELRSASNTTAATNASLLADRAKLFKDIEAHVARCTKSVSKAQAGGLHLRYVPTWYAVVGALVGAVALAIAWNIGVIQGTARAEEAAVGRAFSKVVPSLDQNLRDRLLEHLRKKAE